MLNRQASHTSLSALILWLWGASCVLASAPSLEPAADPEGAESGSATKPLCRQVVIRRCYASPPAPLVSNAEDPGLPAEGILPASSVFSGQLRAGERAPGAGTEDRVGGSNYNTPLFCTENGGFLSQVIRAWCEFGSWQLIWDSKYDYPIEAPFCFGGSLESAMGALIDAYQDAQYPLRLDLYPKQKLAVVSDV